MSKNKFEKRLAAIVIALTIFLTGGTGMTFAGTGVAANDEAEKTVEVTENLEVGDDNSEAGEIGEDVENGNVSDDGGNDGKDDDLEEPDISNKIVEISLPANSICNQSITAYSGKKPQLPVTLSVKTEGTDDFTDIEVQWKSSKTYNHKIADTYIYECSLPPVYTLAEGVNLPQIIVKVNKCAVKITGAETSRTKKSRSTLYDTITVYNGYGSTLYVQMYSSGKWITKKKITLNNSGKQQIKVIFPNQWWKVNSSKWRMKIGGDNGKTGTVTKTCKVTTKRYYQNPSKYVQIQDKIKIDNSGGYTLKKGYMGLKVRQVNRYFKIGNKYWPRYTAKTKEKVKKFQKRKGLKVTGNVDKKTWLKMGYSESSWYKMGAYVSSVKVNPSSTKKEHIEAMIDRAYDYLGSNYVVGASGTPKQGADCSGLVMQCLYAAGVEMKGINPVTHSWAGHEYESRNMWNKADFKKVPYKNKKRGDLIFYKGSSGQVNHVAIYLGNGKVIESWPNKVRIAKVKHHPIKGVMRVFN